MNRFLVITFSLICLSLPSCTDNLATERLEILNYLENNGKVAKDTLGIFIIVDNEGGENKPFLTSSVTINYIGKYLDGTLFDQSNGDIKIKLSSAINGLQAGIPFFGKNGSGTIIIPSNLGFGNNPPRGVKKSAILIFEINVKDF